jgi:hypothetical protein
MLAVAPTHEGRPSGCELLQGEAGGARIGGSGLYVGALTVLKTHVPHPQMRQRKQGPDTLALGGSVAAHLRTGRSDDRSDHE